MNNDYQPFVNALPVWIRGEENTLHVTCGLYTAAEKRPGDTLILKVATSGFYRVFINGEFCHYGPARCAHDFFRVDELDITAETKEGENHIAIETVGYRINGFYAIDQPSFVQAELFQNGESVTATGAESGFRCFRLNERRRKMQRYSFQRAIAESYRLSPGVHDWRIGALENAAPAETEVTEHKALVPRKIPYHRFPFVPAAETIAEGTVRKGVKPATYRKDRSLTDISPILKGFPEDELELHLSDEIQEFETVQKTDLHQPYTGERTLTENDFFTVTLGKVDSGFLCFDLHCLADGAFYIAFDETLTAGDVDPLRMDCVNAMRFDVKQGEYSFISFEAYSFQYIKFIGFSGEFQIRNAGIREYHTPVKITAEYKGANANLKKIHRAAIESFRQNAPDIYVDCPSRERAGWLCDSFFIGRVEKALTGQNTIEEIFLENYLLAKEFRHIPKGMIASCYPADMYDGMFIPNWAMWFVLQLADYQKRGGNPELVAKFRPRLYELAAYFEPFENEFGLLEDLENWVFVEWSEANNLTDGVNFPSNMVYGQMLKEMGALYGDAALTAKGEKILQTVRQRAFNGTFFTDHEIRQNGVLLSDGKSTETCQYYAFYFGIATPESHPELWKKLITEFGPDREKRGLYPEIYPANAFIGNYLRLDILTRYGYREQVLKEIEGFFLPMAETTGTLWENMGDYASCNHGFASYAAYLIDQNTR